LTDRHKLLHDDAHWSAAAYSRL